MLYNNQSELISILKRENLYTEKKLGQNFLFNGQVIQKIIEAADIKPGETIVEVGPGLGILTGELVKHAGRVITIEKDDKLIPYLQRTFASNKNLEIWHEDVLKSTPPGEPFKVVANIPYYITSPIISHFLQNQKGNRPTVLILLTQLEVAEKICAKEGDHTILSLLTQLYTAPKIISKVSPACFVPAPKVFSAILKLETLQEPQIQNVGKFKDLIKKAFSQKRKTLSNSLNTLWGHDKTFWSNHLEAQGISPMIRPEKLTFKEWNTIIRSLTDK